MSPILLVRLALVEGPLTPLWAAGQEVITQMRLLEEAPPAH